MNIPSIYTKDDAITAKTLTKDSVARVKQSIHTITNKEATFIVYRMVPTGEDKKETIKSDKKIINVE